MIHGHHKVQLYKFVLLPLLFVILTWLRASSMSEVVVPQLANPSMTQSTHHLGAQKTFLQPQQGEWKPWRVIGMERITAIAFLSNGTEAVVGTSKFAAIIDLLSGATKRFIFTNVRSLAVSPNNQYLLTTGGDDPYLYDNYHFYLWSVSSGKLLLKSPYIASISSVAFSPDSTQVLVANPQEEAVDLYDIATAKRIQRFFVFFAAKEIAFTPDGGHFVVVGDSSVQLWNISKAEVVRLFPHENRSVFSIAISANGLQLLTGTNSGTFLWDINNGQQLASLPTEDHWPGDKIALTPDNKQAMTEDSSGVRIWDIPTQSILLHFAQGNFGALSPTGQQVLVAESQSVSLYDIQSGQLVSDVVPELMGAMQKVDIRRDNNHIITGRNGCAFHTWEVGTGRLIQTLSSGNGRSVPVEVLALSPDGQHAITSCGDRKLWLWDMNTGKTIHNFNDSTINNAVFSPDGQTVAGSSIDGEVFLWNTIDGLLKKTIQTGSRINVGIIFSPDGSQLLTIPQAAKAASLWDVTQGTLSQKFEPTDRFEIIYKVAFSVDGKQIYTAGYDRLAIWEVSSGIMQKTYPVSLGSLTNPILNVSPSGTHILYGDLLLDLATGESSSLLGNSQYSNTKFSFDGKLILNSSDATVWLWSTANDDAGTTEEVVPLPMGSAISHLVKLNHWRHHTVATEAGKTARVTVTPLDNIKRLGVYNRFGSLNAPYEQTSFNVTARGVYEFLLTPTRSGIYYFSVFAWNLSGETGNFRIEASYVDRLLSDFTPRRGGNSGVATLQLIGVGFVSDTQIQLRNSTTTISASVLQNITSRGGAAEFNLSGKPPGMYDLHAIWPDGQTQTIPNAFEIVAGQGAKLDATLVAPEVHRPQRINPLTIQYANVGDADLPAPLFVVSAQPSAPLKTLCDTAWRNGPIQLLGLNPNAPFDRLPPGINGVTHAQFEGGEENLTFQLDVMDASPQPIPWDSFKATMRPTAISESEWNTLWPQLTARLGATWADYLKVLHRNAQRLRQQSDTPICVPDLLMMEVDALRGKGLAAISGKVINAATGAPILGVDIGARQEGGAVVRLIATDLLDGSFTFANLPDGNYQLSVEGHVLDPKVIVPIANHQDALGIQVAARPYVPLPTPTAPKPADSQPALTVDATGNAHMVWQRDGEIWYARYNEQGQWAETQPISNAIGTDPVIAYDSKLVGSNTPGLAVVWEVDDGTGSYLKQSIAPMSGNTVNGWSAAADVTNSQQSDGQAALTTLANGQPLVLWLQRDMKQDDDTDLYYKPLDTNTLIVIGAGQPNVQNLPDFLPRAETCQGVEFDRFSDIDPKLPIIGGKYLMKIAGKSCYEQTGVPICKLNISGDLAAEFGKETWSGRNGYNQVRKTSVSGKAALTANSITDIDVCRYIVDQVDVDFNLAGNFDVSAEKIPIISAINAIPYIRVQLGATLGVNGGGRLSWQNMTNPLGEYDVVGNARFGLAGGVYGLIEAFDGAVGARVDGNAAINLCYADQLTLCPGEAFCVAANATFKSMLITHSWAYKAGSCASAIQSVSHSSIANSAQTVTLIQTLQLGETPVHETLVMQIAPLVGTGNVYEGQTVLANLGSDVTNDSQPATIRTDNGSILAAWTKDSPNLNLSIGSSVVVAEYDGARWLPPNELQGPTRFNSDAAIVLPPGNQPMVLWASAPANVTLTSAITDVINNMNATDIFFSRRTGATWSAPAPVATVPGTDRTVQIATTPNGEVMAVWLHTNGNNIYDIYTSYWNDSSWSTPVTIATETYVESLAAAYVHNQILLVWSQKTDNSVPSYNDLTLFHAVWQNGSWSTPTPMDKSANIVNAADLAELARQNSTLRFEIPEYPPQECCQECAPDAPNCHYISPPPPFTFPVDTTPSTNIRSLDPNEKLGLAGQGDQHAVAPGAPLRYTIFFENMATASAPAQEVFITDQLDTNLDLTTLHFEEVTIADKVIPVVDESLGQFHIRQSMPDYRSTINKTWWVDITGQLEPVTRVITWTLRILDPETGDLPADALAGFLPPNDATGRGEGHVTFSIYPNTNTTLGTRINNKATIVFDTNPPIITNEVFNTIDNVSVGTGQVYLPLIRR